MRYFTQPSLSRNAEQPVVEAATPEWWDPATLHVEDGWLDVLDVVRGVPLRDQLLRFPPHLGSDAEDVPDPERAKVARLNNQDVSPTIHVADLSQE